MSNFSQEFLDYINSIKSKRPATVIQHILKHGYITSEELTDKYGYLHPPRAIRDVRELGIPIITSLIKGDDGKKIAHYQFGPESDWVRDNFKASGRTAFSRGMKSALIEKYGAECAIYRESMDPAILQIDHRIPYEIGGERFSNDIEQFMLLSPSANRAKSWTCEHCPNWTAKDIEFCRRCYWAYPEDYDHIAGKQERVVNLVFTGNEINDYNQLIALSGKRNPGKFIKKILKNFLKTHFPKKSSIE